MENTQTNQEPQDLKALDAAPCSAYILDRFPKPCVPRKAHQCRVCGQIIAAKEPCCNWSALVYGEGFGTWHAHPECYAITEDWDDGDWEITSPGDDPRPKERMQWPNAKAHPRR